MARVLLVFVDGLGLGAPDPATNPLTDPALSLLANWRSPDWRPPAKGGTPPRLPAVLRDAPLAHDGRVAAADASLGVPGLPQSATGQTTILTGINAAQAVGAHVFGFPTRALRDIIARRSIFRRVIAARRTATFANAYRPRFFAMGEEIWLRRSHSATTWANRAAGLRFRDADDLARGRAVYQDITHDSESASSFGVEPRTPERAGEILAAIAREHAFTLFEFFQTDRAGHAQDRVRAEHELQKLERFLRAALAAVDSTSTTVIVASDHGNIEDLSVKSHTMNPVATLVFGRAAAAAAARLDRLERITPAILDLLEIEGGDDDGEE